MTEISASEVRSLIEGASSRREYSLRDEHGRLFRTILQHELETLAEARMGSGKKAHFYIAGMVNKHGLRWVKMLVPARLIVKLLRKKLATSNSPIAEDNRTIERFHCEGGGIVYSHRHDLTYIWRRRLPDFGAKKMQNKAPMVVPRRDQVQRAHA